MDTCDLDYDEIMIQNIQFLKKKRTKKYFKKLCNDTVFMILSFLSFDDIKKNKTYIVSKQFYEQSKVMEKAIVNLIFKLKSKDQERFYFILELIRVPVNPKQLNCYKCIYSRISENNQCDSCEYYYCECTSYKCKKCGKSFCEQCLLDSLRKCEECTDLMCSYKCIKRCKICEGFFCNICILEFPVKLNQIISMCKKCNQSLINLYDQK